MPKLWSPWTAFLDVVSSKLAFYPPSPSTYRVLPGGAGGRTHARLHPDTCPTSHYTVTKVASPRGHLVTVGLGRCTTRTCAHHHVAPTLVLHTGDVAIQGWQWPCCAL